MENIFEGSFENFEKVIDQAIPDNIGMTDEEYEALLNKQIAEEFAKLDSKQTNQQTQSNQTEKETEMNTQAQETLDVVTETAAVAVAESNTKVVAKKVAIILGKALAGAVVGGGLVVAGAHNHKKVNKAVKSARKRIGKVIPAVAPKPWWKF
jgi:hypothetical protein